eukprot:13467352-Alexandrium_andersonii.AAC.1
MPAAERAPRPPDSFQGRLTVDREYGVCCATCLGECEPGQYPAERAGCGHQFHLRCIIRHVEQAEAAARCPRCDRAVDGAAPRPTCPCERRRTGGRPRCGSPCEHGRWTRAQSCQQCGILSMGDADDTDSASLDGGPERSPSVTALDGPDDADLPSAELQGTAALDPPA